MRWLAALLALLTGCGEEDPKTIRIATYNVHLARSEPGALITELERGSAQVDAVVHVIATAAPDILLVNELDYDIETKSLSLFRERLAEAGVEYAFAFAAPVNTGVRTGLDMIGKGAGPTPENAQGWGVFEGQFGMAVLSRFPILDDEVRTYRKILWAKIPESLYPFDFYPEAAADRLRLSSKSHWDVPVQVGNDVIHLLASHPTPPVFDGPEDRNGRRNHDEIMFWIRYINGEDWIVSDQGARGGLSSDAAFTILGDLNSDPEHGDSRHEAIHALLNHEKVQDPEPLGEGRSATANWKQTGPLRVDYVLPSSDLGIAASGVLSPNNPPAKPAGAQLNPSIVEIASDHFLVWVDILR